METLPAVRPNDTVMTYQPSSIPSAHEMAVFTTMANQAVASKMYRGVGDQAGVMMIMLAARELGIPPMQALNGGLHIIEGKVEISARMMSAMIRRAGHDFDIIESTDEICVLEGRRQGKEKPLRVSYSIQDAQRAGLVKDKGGWKKVPKDMCFARALSRLARQMFSDVIGIGYVEGEIRETKLGTYEQQKQVEEQIAEEALGNEKASLIDEYQLLFDAEDRQLAGDFLSMICKHFEWETSYAIKNLLQDKPTLLGKFGAWKARQKEKEERPATEVATV